MHRARVVRTVLCITRSFVSRIFIASPLNRIFSFLPAIILELLAFCFSSLSLHYFAFSVLLLLPVRQSLLLFLSSSFSPSSLSLSLCLILASTPFISHVSSITYTQHAPEYTDDNLAPIIKSNDKVLAKRVSL